MKALTSLLLILSLFIANPVVTLAADESAFNPNDHEMEKCWTEAIALSVKPEKLPATFIEDVCSLEDLTNNMALLLSGFMDEKDKDEIMNMEGTARDKMTYLTLKIMNG